MLSYMIPVEEHSPNRNLSLNLNNITNNTNNGNNHSSSDMSNTTTTTTTIITINNLHQDNDLCDEDLIDENTKLLSYEKQAVNGDAMKPNFNHHQKNQKNIMKNVTTINNCDEKQIKNGHVTSSVIKSDNNVEYLGNKLKSLKKNMEEKKQNEQEQSQQKDPNQQNQQKKVTLKR